MLRPKNKRKPNKGPDLLPTNNPRNDWTSRLQWLALYRFEKVLTDSNYLFCKVGTNFTPVLHRKRKRAITAQHPVDDIADSNQQHFKTDPLLGNDREEQNYFDEGLPAILEIETHNIHTTVPKSLDNPVRVSISFGTTGQLSTLPAMPPTTPIAAPAVAV